MSLSLVKTVGGTNGTPANCKSCGSSNFLKAGIAWHCGDCGFYIPGKLERKANSFEGIKKDIEHLNGLHAKIKSMLKELSSLVKE